MDQDNIPKSNLKIIQEADHEYVLASDLPELLKDRLKTSLGVPAARTIRSYVEDGILDRPQRRGKETYFDVAKVVNTILIIKTLKPLNPTTEQMMLIIFNAKKHGEVEVLKDFLTSLTDKLPISNDSKSVWFEFLGKEKPSELRKKDLSELWEAIRERNRFHEEIHANWDRHCGDKDRPSSSSND